jgi:hypothetical protein
MLKHSHYVVRVKYHLSMNALRATNSYGTNWVGRSSGVFLETNLIPYGELDFDTGKFTSMSK